MFVFHAKSDTALSTSKPKSGLELIRSDFALDVFLDVPLEMEASR